MLQPLLRGVTLTAIAAYLCWATALRADVVFPIHKVIQEMGEKAEMETFSFPGWQFTDNSIGNIIFDEAAGIESDVFTFTNKAKGGWAQICYPDGCAPEPAADDKIGLRSTETGVFVNLQSVTLSMLNADRTVERSIFVTVESDGLASPMGVSDFVDVQFRYQVAIPEPGYDGLLGACILVVIGLARRFCK